MDKATIRQTIIRSAVEANILPITSRCDAKCVFCSHKNNPPEVHVVSVGERAFEDIAETLVYLRPDHAITIGESASCIYEGEPFTHPQFKRILAMLRDRFPHTPVSITTNGHYLSREMVKFLRDIGNVALSVSINSATAEGRAILMGDDAETAERTIQGVRLLKEFDLPYSASMVAMPNLVGWEDIRATLDLLAENGASVARIFAPAFSSPVQLKSFPDPDAIYGELRDFIDGLPADYPMPVLLEPSYVTDLTPVVSGVLKGTAGWRAGVLRGDTIKSVNGQVPRCRVEAWNMLQAAGKISVFAVRGEETLPISWVNEHYGASGITMEYDFDMGRAELLKRLIMNCTGRSLCLCSELAHGVLSSVLKLPGFEPGRADCVPVKNRTFGGSIKAAGLLCVRDYLEEYEQYREENPAPAQIIIPQESFNSEGYDLAGRHFSEIERASGVRTELG